MVVVVVLVVVTMMEEEHLQGEESDRAHLMANLLPVDSSSVEGPDVVKIEGVERLCHLDGWV